MIILDDVEDRDEVKNPQLRQDTLEWLYNDVMPALDDRAPWKYAYSDRDFVTLGGTAAEHRI
jgi:hypothetical protein